MEQKQIKGVILGYGDRGSHYADYAKTKPEEFKIVGVIDISDLKRCQCKEKLPDIMAETILL